MNSKLKTGDSILHKRSDWKFDSMVANNFVSHAKKSIIGYEEGHNIVCSLSDFFCSNNSSLLEIGFATGELLKKLYKHNVHKSKNRYYGIDNEKSMVEKAKKEFINVKEIKIYKADVVKENLPNNDFTVSYYTMQFIAPKYRHEVYKKIYDSLNWGGGFVLFEKVRGPDARFQDIFSNLYNNFKLSKGFSAEEILGKSESIKGVLEPFSTEGNLTLLKNAGFTDIVSIYKNICFEGFLCIK